MGELRVISGGQTGVDRAALDAALAAGLAVGGWCPRGRRAEDGAIPARYPLRETAGANYAERTAANIDDADATLILVARPDPASWGPGTRLTRRLARRAGKAHLVVCLDDAAGEAGDAAALACVRDWLAAVRPAVLNVAGPRESGAPGMGGRARAFLDRLFATL